MATAELGSPVRVALIVGKWLNYGVESLLLELARQIDRSRVQFVFIIDDDSGDVPEQEIKSLGASVIRIPPYQHPIRYHRHLVRVFQESNFDIIHAHTSTLAVFPLWAAWSAKAPVRIAHVHTMASTDELLKSALKYTLRPLAKIFPTHLAASSWQAAEWMFGHRAVQSGAVFYLPVARDLEAFRFDETVREEVRSELDIGERFVVGHLGRFVPQKNHRFLLGVFREVLALDRNAVLLLAGDGPLVDAVVDQARAHGVANSVRFLGRRPDPARLYQAMDVFVLPSLYEGVPGTGVEAQAAGLPLVYSDRVTDEIRLLKSTIREPLESGPRRWAELIMEAKNRRRTDTLPLVSEAGFGSQNAADLLAEYYEKLVRYSLPSRSWRTS